MSLPGRCGREARPVNIAAGTAVRRPPTLVLRSATGGRPTRRMERRMRPAKIDKLSSDRSDVFVTEGRYNLESSSGSIKCDRTKGQSAGRFVSERHWRDGFHWQGVIPVHPRRVRHRLERALRPDREGRGWRRGRLPRCRLIQRPSTPKTRVNSPPPKGFSAPIARGAIPLGSR